MLSVIAEFKVREGAEAKFEQALGEMQARVKTFDGCLGEEPRRSLADEKKFVTIFYLPDGESMVAWRDDAEHRRIQELAREKNILLVSHLRHLPDTAVRAGRARLPLLNKL